MHNYFIESFKITKLWGYRNIDLAFNNDVNILIGPNGSGKTTVLNLLHSLLTADSRNLLEVNFNLLKVKLRSFKDKSVRTISMKRDAADGFSELHLGKNRLSLNIDSLLDRNFSDRYLFSERTSYGRSAFIQAAAQNAGITKAEKFYDELTTLVPIAWLPVSRRLPVTEYEKERYTRKESLESVDLRLEELLEGIFHYHSRLNAQLSERYKEFERQVLSAILYNKDHDQLHSLPPSLPTEAERTQLSGAFEAAGLLDGPMQSKIDDHFAAAEKAVERIHEGKKIGVELEDILVVPLIQRTQTMVEHAAKLEKDRERIFAPLRRYEKTVNAFLEDKFVEVEGSGELKIRLSSSLLELDWHLLSSGEKQILILLTEALLRVDEPVVYIADEPELSLHVTWQEKLLESLVTLGGQKQIIVATHSPDIVGKYHDKVVDLREGS